MSGGTPDRVDLATATVQAWFLGGGVGTFVGMLPLVVTESDHGGMLFFAVFGALAGLTYSFPAFLAGLVFVQVFPGWFVRWRAFMCAALPILSVVGWELFTAPRFRLAGVLVGWDAVIAGSWWWSRTRQFDRNLP